MEGVSKKRKREDDPPRITVLAPHKTFERLFKESSLSSLRSCIGKKLGFDEKTPFELVQSRNGRTIDLEDDDDFDAFRSFAYSNGSAEVRVRVNAQARSVAFTSEPEIIPSSSDFPSTEGKKRKKSGHKPTDDFPADPSTYSTSGAATSSATNESENPNPKAKKKKKANADIPAGNEAESSKPSEPLVAAEGDKLTTKKQRAASTASSIASETDAAPKSKKNKTTDDGAASDPSKAKTKSKSKQNGADASDKLITIDSSENASNGPTRQPEPSEPLPKKKEKKKPGVDAGPSDSSVISTTDPIGPLTQAGSTPAEATAAATPSKKVSKKTKRAENNGLSSTEKERSVESAAGDVEKEASSKHPRKEIKRVPRGSKSRIVHEQTPSSVDNLSLGPDSEVQEPASSSAVQPQNPVNNQEPVKKKKKLNEKVPQHPPIVPTSTAEESVGGSKKRKVPTGAPLTSQVPEEDAPSSGPARKKKRVSAAAVDALDDIINNILKNPSLPSTSTSQLQSVSRASTSVSATTAKNRQLTSDAQGVDEGEEKEVATKAKAKTKAKAGKNRKKDIAGTDKSVASSSSAKEVVPEVIPHKAAKPGKRGTVDKEAADQQAPASVAVATEVKAQSTAEQPQASNLATNRQQSICGNNSSPRPSKKQTKGNGQASAAATRYEQRSTSLGLLPFAPSGSSLSEVLVEGKDEGSSSESEDESHDSDSSDGDVIPPLPPPTAGRFRPSPNITIPALTEMSLLESLLKPSTPRSWREILSSSDEDSEEEKVSSVPDEDDEEGEKREKKKRRSSAFIRRSPSTPSVDNDDDDNDNDGAVAFGVAKETPEKADDTVASIEEERIDEVAIVEPLQDRNNDQDFLAQNNTDSGYGSTNLKQPDGIEAGPLFSGSQRSTTESELDLSFKAINDRGESVISEGRRSQDAASIKSDGPQVFTRSAQETASRTAQHHSSSPDPIGLMIDDDPIENMDSGNDSSRSQRQSVEEHEHQLPVHDAAATSVEQGHQSSEDLTFLYPDAQEPVWLGEPTDHDKIGAIEKEAQTHVNGLPNVTRRSFTPPPIATLAPSTPGTIKRMRDRHGKLPNPPDISKCIILVPASSQVDSGNTADSAFGDTTEGEDRIDQLLSSSVPRSYTPANATTINTVKRPRKVAEQWPEGKGENLPIGTRLRKRGLSKQAEIAIPMMPPPVKVRRSARARKEHHVAEPSAPVTTIVAREMEDTNPFKLTGSNPSAAAVGGNTSKPPPRSDGVSTSLSEVEDVLDATSGKTSTSSFDIPPPTNTKGSQQARSPASDSDEEKLVAMTERDFAPRPSLSSSFRSLQNIANQKDLFSSATSQPSFLLTPVISFESKAMPNSKGEEDDEDDSSSDSDSDDVNQSVIPKEKRAGNKSKPRGALAAIKGLFGGS